MIELSNGHRFEFMVASGALAFDGRGWPWEWPLRWIGLLDPHLFTIVTKTITRRPEKGNFHWYNPLDVLRPLKDGWVNAIGLSNSGIDWWIRNCYPRIEKFSYHIVVSFASEDRDECLEMAQMLNNCEVQALEFNASCPSANPELLRNSNKVIEICRALKEVSRHPLILKLNYIQNYLQIAKETEGMVEGLSINSVPWKIVFGERISPLTKYGGGGVSGKIAQSFTWKMVEDLIKNTSTPVIGPSVWEYEDIEELKRHGAQAISFGSIFLRHPWKPTIFVKRWMNEQKLRSFQIPTSQLPSLVGLFYRVIPSFSLDFILKLR